MHRSTSSSGHVVRMSHVKRIKELQQENDLLKLLYADLLQKFSAMKDGFVRRTRVC